MENIVAQLLQSNNRKLYFYSNLNKNNSNESMEIDFLIKINNKICPIEVKSSKRYTYNSLNKFKEKFRGKVGQAIILHTKDLRIEKDIFFLPLYMAGLL